MKQRQFELSDGRNYTLAFNEEKPPFDWHVSAFKKLVGLDYSAYFAEVGCGKTAIVIYVATAHFLAKEIDALLILAPYGVYRQWANEQLPEHMAIPYEIFVWGDTAPKKAVVELAEFSKRKTDKLKIVLANTEAFSYPTYVDNFKEFLRLNKCGFCIDEATQIKTVDAARTINIIQGLNNKQMFGKRFVGISHLAVKRYIATGTQVDRTPLPLYSMFSFLCWNFFKGTYSMFRAHYAIEKKNTPYHGKPYYSRLSIGEMQSIRDSVAKGFTIPVIARNLNMLESDVMYIAQHPELGKPWKNMGSLKKLIDDYSFSITLDEAFEDAPEKVNITLTVKMSDEQRRVYNQLKATLYTQFGGREMTVKNKLTLSMRLQQVTGGFLPMVSVGDQEDVEVQQIPGGMGKYKTLLEDLEDNDVYPVIIFCRFTAEAEYIAKQLKKDTELSVSLIIGRVPNKEREEILAAFNKKEVDVLIATPGCLSRGRNMQVSHVIYFYSLSFSVEEHTQERGRIRRATQKNVCIYKYLMTEKSVDERVVAVLKEGEDLLSYMQAHDVSEYV